MKILGIDTSAKAASAAVCDEDKLLAEFTVNTSLTHSQTIMPMVKAMLDCSHITLEQVDCFAVSAGPGSFTGLRIGMAAIKGMAVALNKPCVGVSTLEALAYNLRGCEGIICPAMDARCAQVYTAIFECKSGALTRITDDMAVEIEKLGSMLAEYQKPIFFVGDGAYLCYNELKSSLRDVRPLCDNTVNQRASSVCRLACDMLKVDSTVQTTADMLLPKYLRLPQAERNLKK